MNSNSTIAIYWSVEDILSRRSDLTEQQAVEVLSCLKTSHDATIGINWEVIDIQIEGLFPECSIGL